LTKNPAKQGCRNQGQWLFHAPPSHLEQAALYIECKNIDVWPPGFTPSTHTGGDQPPSDGRAVFAGLANTDPHLLFPSLHWLVCARQQTSSRIGLQAPRHCPPH
jgi:hypothetical protein